MRVAIALGSNLGDRDGHLAFALAALGRVISNLQASSWIETDPVGGGDQPRFLNGVAVGETALPARRLLDELLRIEAERGRTRVGGRPTLPRTLDLDLILYGDAVIDEPGLQVPHPRFRDRLFVLEPLAEVAAGWIDPVTRLTVAELLYNAKGRR